MTPEGAHLKSERRPGGVRFFHPFFRRGLRYSPPSELSHAANFRLQDTSLFCLQAHPRHRIRQRV